MAAQRWTLGQHFAHRRQKIASAQTPGFVIVPQGRYAAAQRHAVERLWRIDFKDPQFTRWFFNKLLDGVIARLMVRHQIEHRLQTAFTQPAFHSFKPLRRIVHLRGHGADHHNGVCPPPGRFLHRDRIADTTIEIAYPIQQRPRPVEAGDGAGGAKNIEPGLFLRRKIARRVVVAAAGAHPEGFAGIEQARGVVHRQRHFACGSIQQPVEIDKISPAHKAQRIEEVAGGGVTHDHFAGVARLVTNIRREVLRPGGGTKIEIERVKLRTHKLIQHASREDPSLPPAFANQRNLAWPKGFQC